MLSIFHGATIGNHDLKIVDCIDIEVDFLVKTLINKIMGDTTINRDDDFYILNVTN